MIGTYLITIGLIMFLLVGWIVVEQTYKQFTRRHPELGPFRDTEGGCGCCSSHGSCSSGSCSTGHGD